MEERIKVFLSYAYGDKVLRDKLAEHLSLLKRHGLISIWYDRDISAGTEWQREDEMGDYISRYWRNRGSQRWTGNRHCGD